MVKFGGDFVTQWFTASDEEYTTNMPHIVTHMREGDSCEDITAQRTADLAPTPNCVVWQARVGEDTLLEILACEHRSIGVIVLY